MVSFLYCSCSSFCFIKTPESSYTNCPSAVCDNTSTTLQLDQQVKVACTHTTQGCNGTARMPWTCSAHHQANNLHRPVHAACETISLKSPSLRPCWLAVAACNTCLMHCTVTAMLADTRTHQQKAEGVVKEVHMVIRRQRQPV